MTVITGDMQFGHLWAAVMTVCTVEIGETTSVALASQRGTRQAAGPAHIQQRGSGAGRGEPDEGQGEAAAWHDREELLWLARAIKRRTIKRRAINLR